MCERNDTPGNDNVSNLHFARFKKKLAENNFKSECRKCSSPGYVLLQKQDVYCAKCLQDYCIQKFRSTIGKSRLVKSGDQILVCVSGGIGSIAMLDMIRFCQQLSDVHKRIRYIPSILHIHEGILNNDQPMSKELFDHLSSIELTVYVTTLEQFFNDSSIELIKCNNSNKDDYSVINEFFKESSQKFGSKLKDIFDKLKSLSSKQDFLNKLRLLEISRICKELGIEKFFLGSTMSELAVDLMNDMSLGKGMQIHSLTNFDDDRFSPIKMLRPMREFSNKEMIFYVKNRNLEKILHKTNESTTTNQPIKSSIFKMTEFFLNNLQNDFPSTIHTIFHTGSKLTSFKDNTSQKCLFCFSKIDIQKDNEYSAYDALILTSKLSTGNDGNTIDEDDKFFKDDLLSNNNKFCYSCNSLSLEIGNNQLKSVCLPKLKQMKK